MTFHAESLVVEGETDDGKYVLFTIDGTESWSEGEHTNERNSTETIAVPKFRARKIKGDLDEILNDGYRSTELSG